MDTVHPFHLGETGTPSGSQDGRTLLGQVLGWCHHAGVWLFRECIAVPGLKGPLAGGELGSGRSEGGQLRGAKGVSFTRIQPRSSHREELQTTDPG